MQEAPKRIRTSLADDDVRILAPTPITVADSVNYSLCTALDVDEMCRLLGDVFAHRDPPAVAVGVTVSEFDAFVRLFCPKADTEGLSVGSHELLVLHRDH